MAFDIISLGITFVNSVAIMAVAFSAGRLVQKVISLEKELAKILKDNALHQVESKKVSDSQIRVATILSQLEKNLESNTNQLRKIADNCILHRSNS